MSTARKLVKNFASLTFAEAITRLCAMLLYIYIARVLGVTSFGQLAFATSVIGFFNFFADFGLTTLGIREIARDKNDTNSLGTNILFFQVILTIFLLGVLGIILFFAPISTFLKWITFIYGLGIIPLSLDMSYIFQAYEKMEFVLWGKSIGQVSYLALGFIFITITKNIVFLPVSSMLGGTIGAAITFGILKSKLSFRFVRPDFTIIKSLAITAIPFVTAGVLANVYHNMDSVMLQFVRSTNDVGLYSSGYKIVNILIMVISFVSNAFFPLISHSYKNNREEYLKYTAIFAQITGIIAIPMALGGILYAKDILSLLYGGKFIQATVPFQILLSLVIIIPFNILISSIVISADRQKENMISVIIGAISNIFLNFLLIPKYGMVGAGIATATTEVLVGLYLLYSYHKHVGNFIKIVNYYFIKPILASTVMIFILLLLKNHILFLDIILGSIVYIFILYLVKGIPNIILSIFAKYIPVFKA